MKRLRLGAICAGIAAGLAVSYGVLAHDFSALKDGSGSSVRSGFGECVESSGTVGSGANCGKTAATAAIPAAMADKKEVMADKKDAMPAAAAGTAAATTAAAGGATALGNHQVGEATPGHLADGQKMPVRTGFGGCVNLGYSVNSPDHPADCAFQAGKPVAAAPAAAPAPAPAPAAAPAPAPEPAPVAAPAPEPTSASAARAVPATPPAVVPGTVRNTSPIGDGSESAAMAGAGAPDTSDEFPARSRARAERGALVDDSQPPAPAPAPEPAPAPVAKPAAAPPVSVPGTVRNTGPAGDTAATKPMESGASDLKDSLPPPPVPAPPTQITRRDSESMDIPPAGRSQDSGAGAAPSAPATDVPGTVRSTAPSGDSATPSGDVQMPAAKPAPIPAPEYEKISLSADVLFKFDRYREKDMLPGGRAKLNDVADRINNYIKDTVESIALTGHTDRLGSDAYNQRLSERRAKTVKNYLVKKGVDGGKITDEGRGEREQVVQCKGNKATKKLIRCLQPNRRVDVEIRGTKQK